MTNETRYIPIPIAVLTDRLDSILSDAAHQVVAGVATTEALGTSIYSAIGSHPQYDDLKEYLFNTNDGNVTGTEMWEELVHRTNNIAYLVSSQGTAQPQSPHRQVEPSQAEHRARHGVFYVQNAEPLPLAHPYVSYAQVDVPSTDHPNMIAFVGDARTAVHLLVQIAKSERLAAETIQDRAMIARSTFHHFTSRRRLICRTVPGTILETDATYVAVYGTDLALLREFLQAVRQSEYSVLH